MGSKLVAVLAVVATACALGGCASAHSPKRHTDHQIVEFAVSTTGPDSTVQWSLGAAAGTAVGEELEGITGSWSHTERLPLPLNLEHATAQYILIVGYITPVGVLSPPLVTTTCTITVDGVTIAEQSTTGQFSSLATCNVILQGEDLASPPAA